MSWTDFAIVFACCVATMLVCRVVPLFLLKGKELPEHISQALEFIPPAAFAALVANDLLSPTMLDGGIWPGIMPLVASLVVIVVGLKTKSLLWCAITGVVSYFLLSLIG